MLLMLQVICVFEVNKTNGIGVQDCESMTLCAVMLFWVFVTHFLQDAISSMDLFMLQGCTDTFFPLKHLAIVRVTLKWVVFFFCQ